MLSLVDILTRFRAELNQAPEYAEHVNKDIYWAEYEAWLARLESLYDQLSSTTGLFDHSFHTSADSDFVDEQVFRDDDYIPF